MTYGELPRICRYNEAEPYQKSIFHKALVLHRANSRELIFLRRFIDFYIDGPLHLLLTDEPCTSSYDSQDSMIPDGSS